MAIVSSIGGGGSGGGASSWYDLEDKPFQEEYGVIDILPLTTYNNFTINPTFEIHAQEHAVDWAFTIGESYTVNWDGTTWTCVGQDASAIFGAPGVVAIGNGTPFGLSGNNESFILATMNSWLVIVPLVHNEGDSHTVHVYQEGPVIKHLDNKYLGILENDPVLLPLKTYTDFSYSEEFGGAMVIGSIPAGVDLTVGDYYTVYWDGNKYSCIAQDCSQFLGPGAVGIGNGSFLGMISNNEPFAIIAAPSAQAMLIIALTDTTEDSVTPHTVQIISEGDIEYKIKSNFITTPDWNVWDENSAAYIANKPFGTLNLDTVLFDDNLLLLGYSEASYTYAGFLKMPFNPPAYTQLKITYKDAIYYAEVNSNKQCSFSQYIISFESNDDKILVTFISPEELTDLHLKIVLNDIRDMTISADYLPKDRILPGVNANFNGRFLQVQNGEWNISNSPIGNSLPSVGSSDNGKILRVIAGEWATSNENGLPTVPSDENNKTLGVVNGKWEVVPSTFGLPSVTAEDDNKVLTVQNGEWTAATVTPASSLPQVTVEDAGKFLRVSTEGLWAVESIPTTEGVKF